MRRWTIFTDYHNDSPLVKEYVHILLCNMGYYSSRINHFWCSCKSYGISARIFIISCFCSFRHLLVQSQQWKHEWNLFKVNNKDSKNFEQIFLVFPMLTLNKRISAQHCKYLINFLSQLLLITQFLIATYRFIAFITWMKTPKCKNTSFTENHRLW